jgi:hypothetical protein
MRDEEEDGDVVGLSAGHEQKQQQEATQSRTSVRSIQGKRGTTQAGRRAFYHPCNNIHGRKLI